MLLTCYASKPYCPPTMRPFYQIIPQIVLPMMSGPPAVLAILIWGVCCIVASHLMAQVQEPGHLASTESLMIGLDIPALERPRVVLLKNERCLTGLVRQLGNQLVVEIDATAKLSMPTSDVQTIADNLEGIYRYKVARYPRLGPGEHLHLARWSMANGLYEHASTHFLAVNREAGQHPIVRQLGIELREQLLRDEGFRAYLGLPTLEVAAAENGVGNSNVVTASTDSKDDLQAPILPAVLTSFTDHVQPILLKRCSQSGCHGFSSSNKLKLIAPSGNSRGRVSEQNCRSVLQFVQVDESQMSTLLRYAIVAHGLQKEASISTPERNLAETIEAWTTFARNPVLAAVQVAPLSTDGKAAYGPAAPAVYNSQSRPGGPTPLSPLAPSATRLRAGGGPSNGLGSAEPGTGPNMLIPGRGSITEREIDQLDDLVRRALGEPPREEARDPFDPAEFNRRHSPPKN